MAKISVIMPIYNAEKYIKKSINCILKQTFKDFELILIDDCGTDRSIEFVNEIKDSRVRLIHNQTNKGIAYSRNLGINIANGKYIALMDDDDLTPLNRLEIQNNYLNENIQIDVVGGRYQVIDENDKKLQLFSEPLQNPEYIRAYMMFYNPMANGSTMLRKKFVDDNSIRYHDEYLGMGDYRFWIECSLKGRITNLSEILLSWRQTEKNETNKCLTEKKNEREFKYAFLQQYALKKNGFLLNEKEITLFNRMFKEDIRKSIASKNELEQLYEVFCNIIQQAEHMDLNIKKEVHTVCKKMFSLRMENSEIWNLKTEK